MTEQVRIETGQLFAGLLGEARDNVPLALVAIAAVAAGNYAIDQAPTGSFAASGFLSLIAQYFVTRFALGRAGLLPDNAGRFGSFWGMCIVTGIAIALGFVLFIIPGLYLAARWFIAAPAILAGDKSVGDGMSESWEVLKDSVWHIVGASALLYGCGFAIGLAPLFFFPEDNIPL